MFVDGRYISPDTWYDGAGTPFQPQVHYFVGGATKLYGAALYRLTAIANAIRVGEHIADRLGASVSASAQGWAPAQRQAPAGAAEAPSAAERD